MTIFLPIHSEKRFYLESDNTFFKLCRPEREKSNVGKYRWKHFIINIGKSKIHFILVRRITEEVKIVLKLLKYIIFKFSILIKENLKI